MSLTPLTKDALITLQSVQYAAQAAVPVRDDPGEPLGDIWFAVAILSLLVDSNVQYVDKKSRLGTSTGLDVDSFVNIFGVTRDSATYATGTLQVAPLSASPVDLIIQFGGLAQTSTGLQFVVVSDPLKSAWSSAGYVIPANTTATIDIAVQCTTAGIVGNVQPGTITSVVSGLGTVSLGSVTVANGVACAGGLDGESDADLISRFQDVIISGRWGTYLAILAATDGTQTGLTYQVYEGHNPDGSTHVGFFTVFVNVLGATTTTPSTIINAVTASIAQVKACGISYTVVSPTLTTVPAAATFKVNANYDITTVVNAAKAAYVAYVNGIGLDRLGSSTLLSYAKVSAVLVTVPGVINVTSFTLNSGTSDITATFGHQFVAGTQTFTGAY